MVNYKTLYLDMKFKYLKYKYELTGGFIPGLHTRQGRSYKIKRSRPLKKAIDNKKKEFYKKLSLIDQKKKTEEYYIENGFFYFDLSSNSDFESNLKKLNNYVEKGKQIEEIEFLNKPNSSW